MIKQILSNRRMMRLIIMAIIALFVWYQGGGADRLLNQVPGMDVPSQSQGSTNSGSTTNTDFSVEDIAVLSGPDLSGKPVGMAAITLDELPLEALTTIGLIQQGGPFPYSKDGSTFQNREGILPDKNRGYYQEYTVKTPGASNRGARRIVGGDEGELYYTADHYDSFSWIVSGE